MLTPEVYDPADRFEPVGRWCQIHVGGKVIRRRFVYRADEDRIIRAVYRAFPEAYRRTAAMYGADATAARELICFYGPEHPELVGKLAEAMGYHIKPTGPTV